MEPRANLRCGATALRQRATLTDWRDRIHRRGCMEVHAVSCRAGRTVHVTPFGRCVAVKRCLHGVKTAANWSSSCRYTVNFYGVERCFLRAVTKSLHSRKWKNRVETRKSSNREIRKFRKTRMEEIGKSRTKIPGEKIGKKKTVKEKFHKNSVVVRGGTAPVRGRARRTLKALP